MIVTSFKYKYDAFLVLHMAHPSQLFLSLRYNFVVKFVNCVTFLVVKALCELSLLCQSNSFKKVRVKHFWKEPGKWFISRKA